MNKKEKNKSSIFYIGIGIITAIIITVISLLIFSVVLANTKIGE